MPSFRAVAYACLFSVACAAPVAAKPPCATPEQVKAAQLRQLHYNLQVAALNCRGDTPEMVAQWQSYVQRHGGTLAENARVLNAYFKSAAAFDRHNTVVTNRESVRVHETPGYCAAHGPLFDKVVALPGPQLAAFAAEMVGDPMGIHACPQKPEGGKVVKAAKAAEKN